MQSRWRSTLCGSKVKTIGDPIAIEAQPSKLLTTGGNFIPHRSKPGLRTLPMLFLPTESYEVITCEDGKHLARYSEHDDDFLQDMEISDGALDYLDSKMR